MSLEIPPQPRVDVFFLVRRGALVFNYAEVVRWEAANGITPVAVTLRDASSARCDARLKFDWDDFRVEVCYTARVDGVPAASGAFVRQMDEWLAEHAGKPPAR